MDLGGHVETPAHEVRPQKGPQARVYGSAHAPDEEVIDQQEPLKKLVHERTWAQSTENGDDFFVAHHLCNVEGC